MFDVVALGELLIDFTYVGRSAGDMRLFEQNPGGAPANVLCALSNLGKKTAFIGKVGADMHGDFLRLTLAEKNVNLQGLIRDETVFTTLAFVELSDAGERSFSFARKPGADTCLRPEELDKSLLESTRIFHFGSLSLTHEPSRSATLEAVRLAKKSGAIISYDPNYRAPLWSGVKEAEEQMRSVLGQVDIIKISDEETALLTGKEDVRDAVQVLLDKGIPCVVVTLGKQGALVAVQGDSAVVPGFETDVVDTTGAGDAYWGGFLYKLIQSGKRPGKLTLNDAVEFASFANAVAALCIGKRGGIPAMPLLNEVEALLSTK